MKPPILSVDHDKTQVFRRTTLRALGKDEATLERLIGEAPHVLGCEDRRTHVQGPYAAFHQCAVETPSGELTKPDIVFLTGSGHVVVVEVKLEDNPDLRGRRVIAQLVEYAASLARYSEDDLTALFGAGAGHATFGDIVREQLPECPDPDDLATELVRRIQAAEIHLVIACDRVPNGLPELVGSVTAQHALGNYELRIVELAPYVPEGKSSGEFILVPRTAVETQVVGRTVIEVKGGSGEVPLQVSVQATPQDEVLEKLAAAKGERPPATPELLAAAEAYRAVAPAGTTIEGNQRDHRKIFVDGWPDAVHYEFLHRRSKGIMGAELHFESKKVRSISEAVRKAVLAGAALPPLEWDLDWLDGYSRVRAVFPDDTAPRRVAEAMVELIRLTRPEVDRALPSSRPR